LNGPTLPSNAFDTLAWAHYCCWKLLLMVTNGLITTVELTVTNGPSVFSQEKLPIVSYGPIVVTNRPTGSHATCCQYPWMGPIDTAAEKYYGWTWTGPLFRPKNAANDLRCTYFGYRKLLPIPLDGLIVAAEKVQPMLTNVPTVSPERCC